MARGGLAPRAGGAGGAAALAVVANRAWEAAFIGSTPLSLRPLLASRDEGLHELPDALAELVETVR